MPELIERRAGYREIGERVARLETLMDSVRERLDKIDGQLEGVAKTEDVKGLLDAWRDANGALRVIKWAATAGAAVGAFFAAFKAKLFAGWLPHA